MNLSEVVSAAPGKGVSSVIELSETVVVEHDWDLEKAYAFTWHVDSEDEDLKYDKRRVRAIRAQLEVCPETKKLHWQGHVELHKKMSMGEVQRKVFYEVGLHLSVLKCPEANWVYCGKKESRHSSGRFIKRGYPEHDCVLENKLMMMYFIRSGTSLLKLVKWYEVAADWYTHLRSYEAQQKKYKFNKRTGLSML